MNTGTKKAVITYHAAESRPWQLCVDGVKSGVFLSPGKAAAAAWLDGCVEVRHDYDLALAEYVRRVRA